MKRFESTTYRATYYDGKDRLVLRKGDRESLVAIQNAIDKANDEAIMKGYPAEIFHIVKVDTMSEYDENGNFWSRLTIEKLVGVYPRSLEGYEEHLIEARRD